MVYKSLGSDVGAANPMPESKSDEELLLGFLLALAAGGRKKKRSKSMKRASACCQILPGTLDYLASPPWTAPTSVIG